MNEEIIENTDEPVTASVIVDDLRSLGVRKGDSLLVHSSLSSLGYVPGGAPTVVEALQESVTEDGNIMMPTFTPEYCNPSDWSHPPVPEEWLDTIRDSIPAFQPETTPTRWSIPNCFRNYPDSVRSYHPQVSFAAWGADAEELVEDHSLEYGLGENTPLASFYDRGGYVLFLGTDYNTNTSFHLAEYRSDYPKKTKIRTGPILKDGERVWTEFEDLEKNTDDFPEVGEEFETESEVSEGTVGEANAKLMDQQELVDFAVEWFEENR